MKMQELEYALARDGLPQGLTLVKKIGMNSVDVLDLYTNLENLGVEIWIDGGWGVDALLGEQTRPHSDLDIAIVQKDVPKLRQLLQKRRYRDIKLEDAKPWNFVLGDENGRERSMFMSSCLIMREMDCTARQKKGRCIPLLL